MHLRNVVAFVLLAYCLLTKGAALACDRPTPLLQDSFATLREDIWGQTTLYLHVANSFLVVQPSPNASYKALAKPLFGEVDFCVSVITLDAPNMTEYYAGLVFWGKDLDDFYDFEANLNGDLSVSRLAGGEWQTLIANRQDASFKKGYGALNDLRVVTAGKRAIFYVNGHQFDEIEGEPPASATHIGVLGESVGQGIGTFAFGNLTVAAPSADMVAMLSAASSDKTFPPAKIADLSAEGARAFASLRQYKPDFSAWGYSVAHLDDALQGAATAEIGMSLKPLQGAANGVDHVTYSLYKTAAEAAAFIDAAAHFRDPDQLPASDGAVASVGFSSPGAATDVASCLDMVAAAQKADWVRCFAQVGNVAAVVTLSTPHSGPLGGAVKVPEPVILNAARIAMHAIPPAKYP